MLKDGLYASLVRAQQFQTHKIEKEEPHDGVTSLRGRSDVASFGRFDINSSFNSTVTKGSVHSGTVEYAQYSTITTL